MSKSDRIVVRLEPDARASLHARASALGLDDAAYVRMLVYRDANEEENNALCSDADRHGGRVSSGGRDFLTPVANGTPAPTQFRSDVGVAHRAEPVARSLDIAVEDLSDEPRAEEMEIPADPDDDRPPEAGELLDEMLAAGPSLIDEMLAAKPQAAPLMSSAKARQTYRRPAQQLPAFGPGSRTRMVGVNNEAIGANNMGDGRGNVLRDNMRHFIRK